MRSSLLILGLWLVSYGIRAQPATPVFNVRFSLLLFPTTPLLTVECRTIGPLSLQGETNFARIHGLNLKYYLHTTLERDYIFVGSAFLRDKSLRQDGGTSVLPYLGWGYAHVFGQNWVADGRIGIGPVLNADRMGVYPVIKIGAGKRF